MSQFLSENIAPIMLCTVMLFLLTGFPVAFSLAACGLFFGFIGIGLDLLPATLFHALPLRVVGIIQNETLLAVPFFTLMGLTLERSGMAEDLLNTIGQVFGPIRGGLALAVIFVGALLAATTGVVAASVISMGLISLPIMLRYGYERSTALGTIAASGTLAQAVPPSLVLIVMADQLGRSVGDLYRGAFVPAALLIGCYALYIIALTISRPQLMPALPPEARISREKNGRSGILSLGVLLLVLSILSYLLFLNYSTIMGMILGKEVNAPFDEKLVMCQTATTLLALLLAGLNRLLKLGLLSAISERVVFVLIPPLALIFLVLGTIFLGIATPTEGGAMGASGALIMAFARKRLNLSLLRQTLEATTRLSVFVMFILIGSTIFSFSFTALDGKVWIEHLFDQLPGGQIGFLIFVNVIVFMLGFFLDFFEIAFILVPLLAPVAENMGIDLVWFGVMLALNLQTSFLTPPFGFALFFLRSATPATSYIDKVTKKRIPAITIMEIYRGAVPFIIIQLFVLSLLISFPKIITGSLHHAVDVDLNTIQIEAPDSEGWTDKNGNDW